MIFFLTLPAVPYTVFIAFKCIIPNSSAIHLLNSSHPFFIRKLSWQNAFFTVSFLSFPLILLLPSIVQHPTIYVTAYKQDGEFAGVLDDILFSTHQFLMTLKGNFHLTFWVMCVA